MAAKNLFVDVRIDNGSCVGISGCGKCLTMCPVTIFDRAEEYPLPVRERFDECTLCGICTKECPTAAITVEKLY